jgi:RimJ/RimL family protein N-acetyltransferase
MRIEPIDDMELIEQTMKRPYIWPHIHDDTVSLNEFEPVAPMHGWLMYLGVFDDKYCGFFLLARKNSITYEIHTVLEKWCRGEKAVNAAISVIEWIFNNTECQRLVTEIPDGNVPAERLAINAGMQQYGLNPHSFKIDNVIKSIKLYGITKG